MREILFRGKHMHVLPENKHLDGRWIEGYLADENYINSPELEGEFLIDTETVCQYTGLTDKNGRKIFEGDIVGCHEKRGAAFWRCTVLWNEENARFDVSTVDCGFPMCIDGYGSDIFICGLDYEVIGNIFDNPELTGGKEE